jgi:kynureninase
MDAFCRDRFAIPMPDGKPWAYFCGNSLGLMPKAAPAMLARVAEQWSTLAVEAHFTDRDAWMPYHALVREGLARLAGANPSEVVAMNTLTTNLHLMMASFYRPQGARRVILIEKRAFPSDRHAVASQIEWHGGSVAADLVELAPLPGEDCVTPAQIDAAIAELGERLALVLWPGVQYATGQRFDLARIAAAAHAVGAIAGFDLAHAIGNVPVDLHAAQADFAVWCSYKYLNAGPGAIAGCFVHERHAQTTRPRLAGWWGHDEASRFRMEPAFVPTPGADGWQLSNPSIFALAPLRASLELFDEIGIDALRQRSLQMTGQLADAIVGELSDAIHILTPSDPAQRGCQLSLRVRAGRDAGRALFDRLHRAGVIGDWREPDVIRVAPAPLYNNQDDVTRLLNALREGTRS